MKTRLLNLTVRKFDARSYETCQNEAEITHTVVVNDLVEISAVHPSYIGKEASIVLGYNRPHLNKVSVSFASVELAIAGRNELINAWEQLVNGESPMSLAEMQASMEASQAEFNTPNATLSDIQP